MEENKYSLRSALPIVLLAIAALLVRPEQANAARYVKTTRIIAIAQSTGDSTAHWIAPIDAINGSCNGAIYVPYDDKEMFAVALTADANKVQVDMYYDNAAPSKTIPYGLSPLSFSTPCKLVAISIKYVP